EGIVVPLEAENGYFKPLGGSNSVGDKPVETVDCGACAALAQSSGLRSGMDTHVAEFRAPLAAQDVRRCPFQLRERLFERLSEQPSGLVVVGVRAAGRLRHDAVDDAQL